MQRLSVARVKESWVSVVARHRARLLFAFRNQGVSMDDKATRSKSDTTPWLPGVDPLPDEPELVAIVRSNPTFTGSHAVQDFERARAICTAIVSGMGVVATSVKFKCSTRTVHHIVRILRERGELQPIMAHVMQRLDEIIDVGTEVWLDALVQGKISPGQTPIPVLAAIDKRSQLGAGVVAGTGRTATELQASDVEAAFALMRSGKGAAVPDTDMQSTGSAPNPLHLSTAPVVDVDVDAIAGVEPVLPTLPSPSPTAHQASAPVEPGGGGLGSGTPPSRPMDQPSKI